MFQQGLYNLLTNNAPLQALLNVPRGDKSKGIFAMVATTAPTMPYITYQRVSGVPEHTYDGEELLYTARFRFSCYGSDQKAAVLVANALKAVFKSFTGALSDGSTLQQAMQEFEADDAEGGTNNTIFATHVDFTFIYGASTPS